MTIGRTDLEPIRRHYTITEIPNAGARFQTFPKQPRRIETDWDILDRELLRIYKEQNPDAPIRDVDPPRPGNRTSHHFLESLRPDAPQGLDMIAGDPAGDAVTLLAPGDPHLARPPLPPVQLDPPGHAPAPANPSLPPTAPTNPPSPTAPTFPLPLPGPDPFKDPPDWPTAPPAPYRFIPPMPHPPPVDDHGIGTAIIDLDRLRDFGGPGGRGVSAGRAVTLQRLADALDRYRRNR
jgi:hypothetical protein